MKRQYVQYLMRYNWFTVYHQSDIMKVLATRALLKVQKVLL